MHLLSLSSSHLTLLFCHDHTSLCSISPCSQDQRHLCLPSFSLIPNRIWWQILLFGFYEVDLGSPLVAPSPLWHYCCISRCCKSRYKLLLLPSALCPLVHLQCSWGVFWKVWLHDAVPLLKLIFLLMWTFLELQVCIPNCFWIVYKDVSRVLKFSFLNPSHYLYFLTQACTARVLLLL